MGKILRFIRKDYSNEAYISNVLRGYEQNFDYWKLVFNMTSAMKRYGSNHWWLSQDYGTLVYYQTAEPILLIDYNVYKIAFKEITGADLE